jgi:hypothetical protein
MHVDYFRGRRVWRSLFVVDAVVAAPVSFAYAIIYLVDIIIFASNLYIFDLLYCLCLLPPKSQLLVADQLLTNPCLLLRRTAPFLRLVVECAPSWQGPDGAFAIRRRGPPPARGCRPASLSSPCLPAPFFVDSNPST